ncbi:RNA polymerase sigma factor [Pseudoxanthomonas sp.]|uniref:RNA polymerase sigma factor n=1 Tax=Pseudoxanthomonas sp. TaxID=1871049 RepID=UPI003F7E5732
MRTPFSEARAMWLSQHVLPHEPVLRAWLVRHVGDLADVDDVIQESYAQLMSLEQVSHIQNVRSYLFTIAKSVVLQGLRRAKVVPIESIGEIERLEIALDAPSPESHASGVQELRHLDRCIAQLPAKCKQAFLMRRVHGLAQREIAQRLGVSENTVEKHIVKALRHLSQALAWNGGELAGRRRPEKKENPREEWN